LEPYNWFKNNLTFKHVPPPFPEGQKCKKVIGFGSFDATTELQEPIKIQL
jgi:hypothetical protein